MTRRMWSLVLLVALAVGLSACTASTLDGKGELARTPSRTGAPSSSSAPAPPTRSNAQGPLADCLTKPTTCNSGQPRNGGSLTFAIQNSLPGWNINYTSNTTEVNYVLDTMLPSVFVTNPDFSLTLNPDLMTSVRETSASLQTIVYTISPKAVWSDGRPIDATDFQYAYDVSKTFSGYSQIKSLTPSAGGKTITVVMSSPYSDWKSLFSLLYPAHVAKQHGSLLASEKWLDQTTPTYSGGPFLISAADKNSSVALVRNPKWYGRAPHLDRLTFKAIPDVAAQVAALQNGEVQVIYPSVDASVLNEVKQISGVNYAVGQGLTWEHVDFNERSPLLADKTLRTAIFTAIDRKAIVQAAVGSVAPDTQPLNSRMYLPAQPGYQDTVTSSDQGQGEVNRAVALLKAAKYTGVGTSLRTPAGKPVSLRCSFTAGNVVRTQTCQLLQHQLAMIGVKVVATPITNLITTLTSHAYDMIVFAWVGSPFPVSNAQDLWRSDGPDNYSGNRDTAADAKIDLAVRATDPTQVAVNLNAADALLTKDASVLPLYAKPTLIAVSPDVVNVRDNANGTGPPYNVADWGRRS